MTNDEYDEDLKGVFPEEKGDKKREDELESLCLQDKAKLSKESKKYK
ncbi:MAG: hypothetical protein IB618_01460 [Candidatus Pacearchaeota archaeon]|nr:MAG: hypothetical protein IB618_01460 [Candidatus Pacearchaeota archaeon]